VRSQCDISVSLLHLHSCLHSCSTKKVLSVYPYPQVCGWSNCGALLQHYCHLHRHSYNSRKENTTANDRREIEWCHHAVLVGTTKTHVSPYQHIYRISKTLKYSHSSINCCVKCHTAAAHSLITSIIFHLLIIFKQDVHICRCVSFSIFSLSEPIHLIHRCKARHCNKDCHSQQMSEPYCNFNQQWSCSS